MSTYEPRMHFSNRFQKTPSKITAENRSVSETVGTNNNIPFKNFIFLQALDHERRAESSLVSLQNTSFFTLGRKSQRPYFRY